MVWKGICVLGCESVMVYLISGYVTSQHRKQLEIDFLIYVTCPVVVCNPILYRRPRRCEADIGGSLIPPKYDNIQTLTQEACLLSRPHVVTLSVGPGESQFTPVILYSGLGRIVCLLKCPGHHPCVWNGGKRNIGTPTLIFTPVRIQYSPLVHPLLVLVGQIHTRWNEQVHNRSECILRMVMSARWEVLAIIKYCTPKSEHSNIPPSELFYLGFSQSCIVSNIIKRSEL